MKTTLLLLVTLTVVACASGYNPRYYYNNIEVANLTGAEIRNVEVQVGVSGRNLRCDSVSNNALCQVRFGKRPYPEAEGVSLSWEDAEGNAQAIQLNPSVPITMQVSVAVRLMMDIAEDGSVRAYFKQETLFAS